METIVFGGGCFWCTEAIFKMMDGISSAIPGYTGGRTKNPTYQEVCSGTTGHAEAMKLEFSPRTAALTDMLEIFFASHDPTQLNRQGNDVGSAYRSAIFYSNGKQKKEISNFIKEKQKEFGDRKIVTEVKPLGVFYPAEEEHLDFYAKNPLNPYCIFIISPTIAKIQKMLQTQ